MRAALGELVVIQIRPEDEIFTYEEKDPPKRCWHFNIGGMKRWLEQEGDHAPVVRLNTALPRAWVERHLIPRGEFEEKRVAQLVEPYLSAPVFALEWFDGTVTLVDGTHRMIRWYRDGRETHDVIIFPKGVWPMFQIDLPGRGTLDVDWARDDPRVKALANRLGVTLDP